MKIQNFIIIGGSAAGMSAASKARRLKPNARILVFERSGHVSYIACGIPYLVSGIVDSSKSLIVYDADYFKEKRDIDVFLFHDVKQICPESKKVIVRSIQTGEEKEYHYDKLLIASGARPFIPPIEGNDLKGIFTLRQLEDGIALKNYIRDNKPRKGLIIGAGSLGLEMAEAFTAVGIEITIIEMMPNILGTMDNEINELVEQTLKNHGVKLFKSEKIIKFNGENSSVRQAVTESGNLIDTELVLVGTGVRPDSSIAEKASIKLGKNGAIEVNEHMETSIPDIFAAGDCAETYHLVYGRNVYMPLGTTANKQGRTAGANMAGDITQFYGTAGTSVFKVFQMEVGRTGMTEKEVEMEGLDCVSQYIDTLSRASFYPGASNIRVKLVAERKTGKLLGAQIAGQDYAAKRVDILATALAANMTVTDVKNLDLGYSPPFSSVYDPILIAANELEKKTRSRARTP